MKMVQDGKLQLDEDVNKKLVSWKIPVNEFTKEQKVTLRRLLTHNAGISVWGFPGYQAAVIAKSFNLFWTMHDRIFNSVIPTRLILP